MPDRSSPEIDHATEAAHSFHLLRAMRSLKSDIDMPEKTPRILVVDDDADTRLLTQMMLARAGYDVVLAADGELGWKSLTDVRPDLLLTDIMLPGLDGFALLRRVRADTRTRTLPVILFSAKSTVDDVAEGLDLGADDYLTKPFHKTELLARVRAKIARPALPEEDAPPGSATGLLSEARFMEELRREVDRVNLDGSTASLAHLAFPEAERIRQALGADTDIASQVASDFQQSGRRLDLIGRDSSGHFLILLPHIKPEQTCARLEAFGCRMASRTFQAGGHSFRLTPISGFVGFGAGSSADRIRHQVEQALEHAALQLDLTPTEYDPSMERAVPGAAPVRAGKWETFRGRLLIPFQMAVVLLLSWVLPFFAYLGLDAIGLDISRIVYIAVVIALGATAFFIWLEGWIALRRIDPPAEPGSPYPPATAIIAAYLPNESATLLETLQAFLRIEYPAPLQIILAYNSPRPMPIEQDLNELAARDKRFLPLRVNGSTSKPQNINAALMEVKGEFVGIFDADHLPEPDAFTRAWRWLSNGADVVQGHCVVRNGDSSWVARMVAVEFEAIYAVSHPGRARLHDFAVFGGSNGYWRTEVLRQTRLYSKMLTEDIDSSIRIASYGRKIVCDPGIISRELAPVTLRHLWDQRVRWAQGWYQVSLRRFWESIRSPSLSGRQKAGIFWLLEWREVYPWIADQMFPLIAFWALKFGGLGKIDWLIPVFVMTTLFTLSVGPGQTLFAYWLGDAQIRRRKGWFVSYLILSSLFYTEFKNVVARIAQLNEWMHVRSWKITPRAADEQIIPFPLREKAIKA
ncbi:MAG: response regulator [Anaerolineales bacterium]